VVTQVARQNDVSTGLIYKWRDLARGRGGGAMFAPVVLAEAPAGLPRGAAAQAPAILVELAGGARVTIASHAAPALVTATLRALR
jgi:transposase